MCGIFAYLGRDNDAPEQTLAGLKKLEYRGYDSWGVSYLQQDKLKVKKRIGKIGDASLPIIDSQLALGHTRWATHGGITQANAHPHINATKSFAVVHNGIVENFEDLKRKLKSYPFQSETDTEVIVALLDEQSKDQSLSLTVKSVATQLEGLNAFVVLHAPSNQIIATTNGSPLVIGRCESGYYLASDSTALAGIASDVAFLVDNQLLVLGKDSIQLFDQNNTAIAIKWKPLELSSEAVDKQNYDHFMLKEINEQPSVIDQIIQEASSLKLLQQKMIGKKLVLVGCGTAYHACLAASYFFAQLSDRWAQAFSASEFMPWRNLVDENTHVIFISQSGETIDIIEHAQWLLKHDISFSAIVNRTDSTLSRLATQTFHLQAGPEICVLATKSFTAQLATLLLLAADKNNFSVIRNQLKKTHAIVSKMLSENFIYTHIKPLARMLSKQKNIFVLGKNETFPIALEAALKIKESSYIHMEGFAAGELKHGVLALVEPGTVVFVLLPDSPITGELLGSAQEAKARGAFMIGIGDIKHQSKVFDRYVPIQDSGLATGISQTLVFQLLAYYTTLALHQDPDKPRNLAKSVTVK